MTKSKVRRIRENYSNSKVTSVASPVGDGESGLVACTVVRTLGDVAEAAVR